MTGDISCVDGALEEEFWVKEDFCAQSKIIICVHMVTLCNNRIDREAQYWKEEKTLIAMTRLCYLLHANS